MFTYISTWSSLTYLSVYIHALVRRVITYICCVCTAVRTSGGHCVDPLHPAHDGTLDLGVSCVCYLGLLGICVGICMYV